MTKTWKILAGLLIALLTLNALVIFVWLQRSRTAAEPPKASGESTRKILFYRHPMQAQISSNVPAKDEMGMDYIPVYEGEEGPSDTSSVEGRATFDLSSAKQQKIGVTTTAAKVQNLIQEMRVTGRVAYDPELYAAIEEYQQALIARRQLKSSSYEGFVDDSSALVKSSETKLKLLGLTDQQIQRIAAGGSQAMNLLLPKGRVWVYAEVFEYEVNGVKPGQKIEAEAPSIPGKVFKGTIASISPVLNAATRTIRVRAEVPDPEGLLRPDTYLNVRIVDDLGPRLVVPEDAVLYTKSQAYVFVRDAAERFHPRAVQLGAKGNGLIEITAGLQAGDDVVTGANFLIDSESKLQSVLKENEPASKPAAGGQP